ncbi:hypothetical protein [Clostridium sp. HBUAS56017]|uniref:hypothetical protein n=1 Tax=Clostridium sp. HBUAS56017 TaxID=2571128 RepID=UPI0011782C30|nr:hypothetical protein [Clostridium sp. HBUAS56017]
MSTSSLWVMDENFIGERLTEFNNSWLFTPIADDILFQKYLPHKVMTSYGKTNFMTAAMFDNSIFEELNRKINSSQIKEDRIVWELTNQQVFFSKDKKLISDCIIKFLETNKKYTTDLEGHIFNRFEKISNEIRDICKNNYPYFVFKNTSCDDGVECWFEKYDEESEEYIKSSLKELDKHVTEFVAIEGDNINFTSNLQFFRQESEE